MNYFIKTCLFLACLPSVVLADQVTVPNAFSAGQTTSASQVNENFQALADGVNTNQVAISDNTLGIENNTASTRAMGTEVQANTTDITELLNLIEILNAKVNVLENSTPSAPAFRLLNGNDDQLAVNPPDGSRERFELYTDHFYEYGYFNRNDSLEPILLRASPQYITSDCSGEPYHYAGPANEKRVWFMPKPDFSFDLEGPIYKLDLSQSLRSEFYYFNPNNNYRCERSGIVQSTNVKMVPVTDESVGFDRSLLTPPYRVEYR